ncbi:unnamed protein product, partial [Protopolystoma xenopodis]
MVQKHSTHVPSVGCNASKKSIRPKSNPTPLNVTSASSANYEPEHCLEVIAKDSAKKDPKSTTDRICIRVLDVNDNDPIFKHIFGI